MNVADTIAAIASAAGGGLRGIVRLSGPEVVACLTRCFQPADGGSLASQRRAVWIEGQLLAAPFGPIDCGLCLWPTARSYTRQPAAEVHTCGSPPVLEAVLRAVCAAGARLAEPGEFTLRAFLAGRLDLTQAEAVLGVIEACDSRMLAVALQQLAGGLALPLGQLRNQLLDLLAHLEAGLDFVDEELEFITPAELAAQLTAAADEVTRLASQMTARGHVSDRFRVVLTGWPNVGKSSLLNALAGESAAIVSATAGTTRDYLARGFQAQGVPCLLIDTAGLEADPEPGLAAAAQAAAAEQSAQADLQLLCVPATRPLNAWERDQLASCPRVPRLLVLTQADGPRVPHLPGPAIETSSVTGQGLEALRAAIHAQATQARWHESRVVVGTAVRCRESLRLAAEALRQARALAEQRLGDELVAAEVRLALDELGKVAGVVYTEDVLERIFSRFCIGK